MRVVLEVISGPQLGRKAVLHTGQAARFGRTDARSRLPRRCPYLQPALPRRVRSDGLPAPRPGHANGTFVNGTPTTETVLNDGDVVRAGQTSFKVHLEGESACLRRVRPEPARPPRSRTRSGSRMKTRRCGGRFCSRPPGRGSRGCWSIVARRPTTPRPRIGTRSSCFPSWARRMNFAASKRSAA